MSDRDELAVIVYDMTDNYYPPTMEKCREIAQTLWAAGWRKKPSVTEVEFALYERMGGNVDLGYPFMPDGDTHLQAASLANAVLALLDGLTETGDSE